MPWDSGYVPLESEEQAELVRWLEDDVCLRFSHVPMSTYTKSYKQKNFNHAQGVRAGVPDMIVLINPKRSKDGRGHLLFIEMKRIKGSTTSTDQKAWIAALNGLDAPQVEAAVAKGFTEAKQFVLKHLKDEPLSLF